MPSKNYRVGDPQKQLDNIKIENDRYSTGKSGVSFYNIRELKPIFAFDYLSLANSELCFNCKKLTAEDYLGFLSGLKINSQKTYNELRTNPYYRFHPIDFDKDKISIKRKDFKTVFTNKPDEMSDEELPTLYQFDLHYRQKARTCGFLYKGVFYIIWFDKDHLIYPGAK